MSVIALVPARTGSVGIPNKNWRHLGGASLVQHALDCASAVPCDVIALTTDRTLLEGATVIPPCRWIQRPAELATSEAPMLAVVQHALEQIPGEPDDVLVLLQPTQPFRKPEHVREAVRLLRETPEAESVVSVTAWPQQYSPELMCHIMYGQLYAYGDDGDGFSCSFLGSQPARRQDAFAGWRRDGTVYAFYRATVTKRGTIYGLHAKPLIIDPADTCELDTLEDWARVEQRWQERHAASR